MASDNERYVDYLDFSLRLWKRPETETRIWRVVNGRRKIAGGEIPRFSIREVPQELEDDAIDFIVKYFIPEEPISVSTGMASDPLAVREFRTLWTNAIRQGVSCVALMVNSDPAAKPEIAGVNILSIATAGDNFGYMKKFRSRGMKRLIEVCRKLAEESDVFRRYGVDKYLGSLGLSVHPSLRGQGVGEELLRARDDIGLAYQIPVTRTIFTATTSQILAARVGFEVLTERKSSEILDADGNIAFPGVTVKFIKSMAKRLY